MFCGKLGPGRLGPGKCWGAANWAPKICRWQIGPRQIGPRQIGPRQIGPRQIGPLGGKLGPGKSGPGRLGPMAANWAPEILLMADQAPANWTPADCISYICIGYILPTIGEYMKSWIYVYIGIEYILVLDILWYLISSGIRFILVLDIFWYWIYSANNWGNILILDIFCQQLADIFWYWIYFANNWEIYDNYAVFVCPSGTGLQIVHFLECVSFFKKAYSATLHPPIDIYPPIVGRIYPIPIYKFN